MPMSTTTKLTKNTFGNDVEHKFYGSMIQNLLYLAVSRPDISFSFGACARYQTNPKKSHLFLRHSWLF